MGSCLGSKDSLIAHTQFHTDQKIADKVYKPLFSTIYSLLRKRSEIQVIKTLDIEQSLFIAQSLFNPDKIKPNDIKLLLNFKNVLLVTNNQEIYTNILQCSNPKAVYVISKEKAKQFLDEFPIFEASQPRLEPKFIPILAIYEKQTIRARKNRTIFLHSEKLRNDEIYKKLNISQIIEDSESNSNPNIVSKLQKGDQKIIYIHSISKNQQNLKDILKLFLITELNIGQQQADTHLLNIFPKTAQQQRLFMKSQYLIRVPDEKKNQADSLETYFKQLYKEMGSDQAAAAKLQRAYNLIVSLISNIYNNKQSLNFRKVRKTNRQIDDLLGKYKSGLKLLQEVGFTDEGGFYVNNTDIKYLKLYRTDLDLAYKNSLINN